MSIAEFLSRYGLFVMQVLTILFLLLAVIGLVVIVSRREGAEHRGIVVEKLNDQFEHTKDAVNAIMLDKKVHKQALKEKHKKAKQDARSQRDKPAKPRLFVLDFKGDIRATGTASLREEVSAILGVANKDDAVLLRLENAGGAVHEHGFAASQLLRLKAQGLKLTVAVDKVAASGGYLMACVADQILAAPFAIIGSIGVLAQLPNFHRLLESKGIDYEQVTAGRFKRTLTMFGQNTDEARAKMQAELEEIHELFKAQIVEHRAQVDIESVATGEHWYGLQAIERKLIDSIQTSDDYLQGQIDDVDIYRIEFKRKKPLPERIMHGAESLLAH